MTTPLTPTRVTDKNGRTTTVHKRLDAPLSASKKLNVPVPALAPQTRLAPAQGTPLPPVAALTQEESQYFRAWYTNELKNHPNMNARARAACLKPLPPRAEAVAYRISRAGTVPNGAIVRMLNEYHFKNHLFHRDNYPESLLEANLRVAERLGRDHAVAVFDQSSGLKTIIEKSIQGYCYNSDITQRVPVRSIETEEELESISAITAFLLNAVMTNNDEQCNVNDFKDHNNKIVESFRLSNRSLDAFIRENPHEVHRVIEYAKHRKIGNTAQDTKLLIKHLDESGEMGAMDEGWL